MNQAWTWSRRDRQRKGEQPNEGIRVTADDLAKVWLDDAGRCRYCDIETPLMTASFDHVIPLSKSGPNLVSNLATCCITCQRTKHTKTPEQHLEYQATWHTCPVDGTRFRPRYADIARGYGVYCSRRCSGTAGAKG